MIPGFNTDVKHNGVTYHVQTEDKGLDSPLILSLIYSGGAILASKRTPYKDLVAAGLDEAVLAERLSRQHTLICAAVSAGRIDDLKKLNERERIAAGQAQKKKKAKSSIIPKSAGSDVFAIESSETAVGHVDIASEKAEQNLTFSPTPEPLSVLLPAPTPPSSSKISEPQPAAVVPQAALDTTLASLNFEPKAPLLETGPLNFDVAGLHLCLLDEQELRAGELAVLCVRVGRGPSGANPVENAEVTVKILGTAFQPVIINLKTNQLGMAVAHATLPKFNAGRAAVLVRAEYEGKEIMLRRLIQQA